MRTPFSTYNTNRSALWWCYQQSSASQIGCDTRRSQVCAGSPHVIPLSISRAHQIIQIASLPPAYVSHHPRSSRATIRGQVAVAQLHATSQLLVTISLGAPMPGLHRERPWGWSTPLRFDTSTSCHRVAVANTTASSLIVTSRCAASSAHPVCAVLRREC